MEKAYSVGQVNTYIKNMFTQDYLLKKLSVRGEVSNCKYHTSGHIYFSLKDETGVLHCVMFAGMRNGLSFRMKDGDKVIVSGRVDVFERDGKYQMYAREIQQEGIGLLYERFLRLKTELEEMGMFAEEYKKPIPRGIKKLGVVTASTGAAVKDICNVALGRNPYLQIILFPAKVQGSGAAESIARGIQVLDQAGVDTIIVGRGGGSIEDLWAFNEEIVARAIFECETPIISAVGHETDFTIADFAADLRAATPTDGAVKAVDDYALLQDTLENYKNRLQNAIEAKADSARRVLENYKTRVALRSPEHSLGNKKTVLNMLSDKIRNQMDRKLAENKQLLSLYIERYDGLSPIRKLSQGYSYVTDLEDHVITKTDEVREGDSLKIAVTDGYIYAEVTGSHKGIGWNDV